MVRLMNISCDENNISCDYIPENSDNIGKVTVDIRSREVTNVEFSKYEYGKKCMWLTSEQGFPNY